jgi:hypothetical protein
MKRLLKHYIKEAEEHLDMPNVNVDTFRCYWEGRLALAKELLKHHNKSKNKNKK